MWQQQKGSAKSYGSEVNWNRTIFIETLQKHINTALADATKIINDHSLTKEIVKSAGKIGISLVAAKLLQDVLADGKKFIGATGVFVGGYIAYKGFKGKEDMVRLSKKLIEFINIFKAGHLEQEILREFSLIIEMLEGTESGLLRFIEYLMIKIIEAAHTFSLDEGSKGLEIKKALQHLRNCIYQLDTGFENTQLSVKQFDLENHRDGEKICWTLHGVLFSSPIVYLETINEPDGRIVLTHLLKNTTQGKQDQRTSFKWFANFFRRTEGSHKYPPRILLEAEHCRLHGGFTEDPNYRQDTRRIYFIDFAANSKFVEDRVARQLCRMFTLLRDANNFYDKDKDYLHQIEKYWDSMNLAKEKFCEIAEICLSKIPPAPNDPRPIYLSMQDIALLTTLHHLHEKIFCKTFHRGLDVDARIAKLKGDLCTRYGFDLTQEDLVKELAQKEIRIAQAVQARIQFSNEKARDQIMALARLK